MTKIELLQKEAREHFETFMENAPESTIGGRALQKILNQIIDSVYRAAIEDAKEAVRHGLLFGATLNAEGEAKGEEALKNLDELMPGV